MNLNDEKPIEYKEGFAMFYGRKFVVDQNVLIPRVETQEIIQLVPQNPDQIIADIGCGSGCLGITLALELPDSTVYLSDISEKVLEIAKSNNRSTNTKYLISDLFDNYPKDLLFDIVVANLPYIPTNRIPTLDSSVRDFEPHQALDGGPEGTTIINKLLQQLPDHLKSNGVSILEIDDTHTLEKFQIPNSMTGEIKKDQFNRNRFLLIRKKSRRLFS